MPSSVCRSTSQVCNPAGQFKRWIDSPRLQCLDRNFNPQPQSFGGKRYFMTQTMETLLLVEWCLMVRKLRGPWRKGLPNGRDAGTLMKTDENPWALWFFPSGTQSPSRKEQHKQNFINNFLYAQRKSEARKWIWGKLQERRTFQANGFSGESIKHRHPGFCPSLDARSRVTNHFNRTLIIWTIANVLLVTNSVV
jgi:hypothetical protein